jgi:uncharacterized protein (TIGR02186 family)
MTAARLLGSVIVLWLLAGTIVPARAERLVIALSNHRVLINSSFTGVDLVLFGSVEHEGVMRHHGYDLVATVTGPRADMVTRRKQRVLGVWVNVESRTFFQAPAYLAVLSNRPLAAIVGSDMLSRLALGLAQIPLPNDGSESLGSDPYRTAFVDINRAHGLYRELPDAVVFLTADLFRAGIALPANVPVGTYDVDVKLFADGLLLAQQRTALETAKVGFEQFVASAAREHGVLYGVATVMLAILTGWFGAVVFRRDFN